MKSRSLLFSCAVVLTLVLLIPAGSFGAAYPEPGRSIRLVVPFAPGGNVDIISRAISNELGQTLGAPIVIDNRGGAGGAIGSDIVAKAAPDGYTTLMVSASHVINPSMVKKLPYDTIKAFAAVSMVSDVPTVLVAHPSVQAKTLKELIAFAKANPSKLNMGTSGIGTVGHLSGELLKSMAQIKIEIIHYKGAGPALIDLLGGHVQLQFVSMPAAMQHIKSGKLRAIAMTGAKRSPAAPDIVTMQEAGMPGFLVSTGFGLFVPAGTPRPIIDKLHDAVVKTLKMPDVKKRLAEQGADPVGSTPEEYEAFVRSEIAKWLKVVKEAGIKPI
ncbi:MAG: tripartite tricarboxylate transporter substrate binding protein [Syntrophales bacterium]